MLISLSLTRKETSCSDQLGTCSTYSSWSSVHFLARCSNFCKALRKIQKVICPTRSPRQSREQVVVRQGQIRRIGWVIKILEAQVGQFLLGGKCPVSRGIVVQEQDPLGDWVEKPPRLNWATQFLTVAYDGAYSPNVSVRTAWISFGALPCGGELDDSSHLDVVEIARHLTCFPSASVTRKDLQFSTWTDPSFQQHYRFHPTTSGSRMG